MYMNLMTFSYPSARPQPGEASLFTIESPEIKSFLFVLPLDEMWLKRVLIIYDGDIVRQDGNFEISTVWELLKYERKLEAGAEGKKYICTQFISFCSLLIWIARGAGHNK